MVRLRQSLQSYSTVLAAVLLSVSCEPSPWPLLADPHSANDRIRAVAGCWRFEPQDSSSPFTASFVLHFDSVPVHLSYTELKLVLDARLSTRTPFRKPYWALAQHQSRILAFWEDSFGVELRLSVHADSISGVAYYTNDMGDTHDTRVRAERLTCPADISRLLPNQRLKLSGRGGRLKGKGGLSCLRPPHPAA